MWNNKYKIARNHRLFTKIDHKPTNPKIKTFAMLNKTNFAEYQLHTHPANPNAFVMFNQIEYLQRQCSAIISESDPQKTLNTITQNFPGQGPVLSMFMTNNAKTSDQLILGTEGGQSLLSLAYKQLLIKKELKTQIFISIIGIQNENSLTDELQFQWLQYGQKLIKQQEGLGKVLRSKARINLIRESANNGYDAQKISRHRIQSQACLESIFARYRDIKDCIQSWIQLSGSRQFEQMGLLFVLSEAEYNAQTRTVTKIVKNHYLLQINQFMRATAPLLLRLSMSLNNLSNQNFKLLDSQDSKLFKLLSQCFKNQSYSYNIFLQVGQYSTFREQHMCLASLSEFLLSKKHIKCYNIQLQEYLYQRHYIDHPPIMKIITDIEKNLPNQEKNKMENIIKEHQYEFNSIKMRLKTKSYHCDTVSSEEKKILKKHLLTQEYPKLALEQLVHQTSKIYRLPSFQKGSQRESSSQMSRGRLSKFKTQLSKYAKSLQESCQAGRQRQQSKRVKNKYLAPLCLQNSSPRQVSLSSHSKKYYEQVRQWLDKVYGRNRSKKIKQFYKSIQKGNGLKSQFSSYTKGDYIQPKIDTEIKEQAEEKQKEEQSQQLLKQTQQAIPNQPAQTGKQQHSGKVLESKEPEKDEEHPKLVEAQHPQEIRNNILILH